MPKFEVNALTLVGVLVALGLSGVAVPGLSFYSQMIAAVILLVVLFAYDREGYRSLWQCLAFAGVAGACVATIASDILDLAGVPVVRGVSFALSSTPPDKAPVAPFPWPPVIWIGVTLILWAVDMSRMQKRSMAQLYASQPPVGFATPTVREEPPRPQPVPAPPAAPVTSRRATDVTSLFSQPAVEREPEPVVQSAPVSMPVAPQPAPVAAPPPPPGQAPPPAPVQASPPAPVPAPAPAQAVPVPRGSGKPATIYLNLVGEGLAVMRSVQAEHIGKDYYLIVEPRPAGEAWEFTTGQVVRCQKRNLSSGKGLVAVEEAPRAS